MTQVSVSCLAYSLTLTMEATCFSETFVGSIAQMIELFLNTTVKTSHPKQDFYFLRLPAQEMTHRYPHPFPNIVTCHSN
jgi:hypothetical protein